MVMKSDIGYSKKPKKPKWQAAKAGAAIRRLAKTGGNNAARKFTAPAPVRRSAPPPPRQTRQYTAPARTNSYASGVNPSGRVGSNSYTPVGGVGGGSYAATPPPPKVPSLEEFLAGDTTWMDQQSQFEKALKDYETEMARQKGVYETDYNASLDNLGVSKEAALGDLEGDFAGRGLLNSGLYADSMAQMEADYLARQTGLETGRSNFLSELTSAFTDFQSEQELATQRARQEAANRRAAKYGV